MTEGKINRCNRLCTWRMISVRLIIHNTYVILCNEIFDKFTSGIIVLTNPEDIVALKSPYNIYGEGSCCSKLSKCLELREKDGGIYTEHIVSSLSRVTEIAVDCSSACNSIFLFGKDDFTNIEAPPEGLRQSV